MKPLFQRFHFDFYQNIFGLKSFDKKNPTTNQFWKHKTNRLTNWLETGSNPWIVEFNKKKSLWLAAVHKQKLYSHLPQQKLQDKGLLQGLFLHLFIYLFFLMAKHHIDKTIFIQQMQQFQSVYNTTMLPSEILKNTQ